MAQLTRTAGQTLSLSEVRAFFDGKFDPAVAGVDGSSLSHYLRNGGIVPGFPLEGGVGFFWDNPTYSTIQDDNNNDTFWPTQAPNTIVGVQTGWNYQANTTAITATANVIDNFWWNTSGSTMAFAAGAVGSMTVDITNWDPNDARQEANFVVRKINSQSQGSGSYTGANTDTIRIQNQVISQTGLTTAPLTAVQSFSIAQGEGLRFFIAEGSGAFTPYDIRLHSLILSTGTTAFSEINQNIPTSSPLSLSQLRNVDDGRTP